MVISCPTYRERCSLLIVVVLSLLTNGSFFSKYVHSTFGDGLLKVKIYFAMNKWRMTTSTLTRVDAVHQEYPVPFP